MSSGPAPSSSHLRRTSSVTEGTVIPRSWGVFSVVTPHTGHTGLVQTNLDDGWSLLLDLPREKCDTVVPAYQVAKNVEMKRGKMRHKRRLDGEAAALQRSDPGKKQTMNGETMQRKLEIEPMKANSRHDIKAKNAAKQREI